MLEGTDVGSMNCDGDGKTVVHDNAYFTSSGNVTECSQSLANWQAAGNDAGSTAATIPDDDTIIGWARELLAM